MAYTTLGSTTKRNVDMELSWTLVKGFPVASGATIHANEMVKLNNDGTVSPIAAVTDKPLGRVCSSWQGTDDTVRVVTPFEAIVRCKANGTLDEGDQVAALGFDTTENIPIFKTAVTTNYVSGICLIGGATTTVDCWVGILPRPFLI